jgi:inosose dehydratase
LHDADRHEEVIAIATRTIDLLHAIGGRFLVTIDHISATRMATAGRRDLQTPLGESDRLEMLSVIDRIADYAKSKDITLVLHQHAGSYIEYEDELEFFLAHLDSARVGVCLDTGHMHYAGIDPVRFYEDHQQRVKYFHFKDVDSNVHARVVSNGIPFLDAVQQKIFCPLGRGAVQWQRLADVLVRTGYTGAANVEQDVDLSVTESPLSDARASLAFLRSVGMWRKTGK